MDQTPFPKKLIIALWIAVFVAAGLLFANQIRLSNQIKEISSLPFIQEKSGILAAGNAVDSKAYSSISGTVTEIKKNSFVVKASVPNVVDLSSPNPPSMTEKTFEVAVKSSTLIELNGVAAQFQDLKNNDKVQIFSDADLSKTNAFTAKKISAFRS